MMLDRLEANLAAAEARYAAAEEKVLAAREAGVDTAVPAGASAASADFTLARLASLVEQRRKDLEQYRAKVAR